MAKISSKSQMLKSGETIAVRTATIPDAEKIHALGLAVIQASDYLVATPEEYSSIPVEQQIARVKRLEDSESDIWLIAESDGELVGMIDFQSGKTVKKKHRGAIAILVLPAWQNRGVGNILLSTLIEWVQSHPYLEVINLTVSEENKGAIALYKKLGFQVTGREPFGLKLPDGRFLVDLTMTLRTSGTEHDI